MFFDVTGRKLTMFLILALSLALLPVLDPILGVVTDIKIDCAAQGSRTIKPTKLEAFRDGYMSNVIG